MVACEENEIPSETDAIAKAWNNIINNMDFNLATKKAATKRICGRTDKGETQQIQARLDEITTKRDGTKEGVSDRDTRMRGGLCQRS